jgi:excinuclease ABC subunit C
MLIEKMKNIPQSSGCYLFKDDKEQIIYVGMSKFLPKRVKSYFTKKHTDVKTKTLVETIRDVEFVITSSEQEAILTEEELIKLYKPKFNIKGKDDKTRSWSICFTDEQFPKLEVVREKSDDRMSLDFTSGMLCREVYDLIHDIFNLRSCSYELSQENINNGKFKVCLENHIERCDAPCVGQILSVQYKTIVNDVKKVFDLDLKSIRTKLKKYMNYHSEKTEFEKANNYLNKINSLDVLDKKLDTIRRQKFNKQTFEIKNILKLKYLPVSIEAFDNSHNQGSSNVAASVRFQNDKPVKSEYRKYIIRTVDGVDDYASFDEVLNRRFKRLIDEKKELPNLVIIDGGKGQLNIAKRVFEELNITNQIDLISISKDNKHKSSTIHLTTGEEVDIMSVPYFRSLAKIQEEVHRFAIKFHREKQSKKLFS